MQLTGRSGTSFKTFFYDNLRFPLRGESNDFLPRLWATRRVGWLMEQIRSNGEAQELRDEVVDLGTRYGIVTPYTSYLALEPNAQQVQNLTSTNNNFRIDGAARGRVTANAPPPRPMQAPDARASTGMAGVQQSKQARQQQEVLRVDSDTPSSAIKTAGGKTFYLRDSIWTDSDFKAGSNMPETVLKFGSDEYFALLKQKPRLAQFLSLGEQVVVVFEGRVYRITAANP